MQTVFNSFDLNPNLLTNTLMSSGREVWWEESRRLELRGHTFCSVGGECDVSVIIYIFYIHTEGDLTGTVRTNVCAFHFNSDSCPFRRKGSGTNCGIWQPKWKSKRRGRNRGGEIPAQAGSLASWRRREWKRPSIGSTNTMQHPLSGLQPRAVCGFPATQPPELCFISSWTVLPTHSSAHE